jgi:DNA primase
MQDAKEEVRARLAIEDVIGEYMELKRAGRNFKGLSPFTGEKTPSFYVSPEKNIWHDFSSNKGGDVFSFVMEVEGMDFREALEHLARKANVDLSMYKSARHRDIAEKKQRLLALHEAATHYYQYCLVHNTHAVDYVFRRRGLSREVAKDFQIGYAPAGANSLVSYLMKKGFSQQELQDGGLTNRFGGDLFKGRMMVPLMNGSGQVIGFTGRIIADEPSAPKYLNTPQTLLYDKSWHVFGLSQAKEAIRQHDYAVVVEGNLDVVSSHQVGVRQTVATAGTAMTLHHLKTLGRLTRNVRLAFDGDRAGIAATERAIPIAQEAGVELTIISLPDGAKDPDELIQRDPSLWQAAIDMAEPVIAWILHRYEERYDITTALGKREYTTAAFTVLRLLQDPVEQDHYLQHISARVSSPIDVLRKKLAGKPEPKKTYKKVTQRAHHPGTEDQFAYQDNVLAICLIDTYSRELLRGESQLFRGEARQAVAAALETESDIVQSTPKQLQNHDDYVKILLLRADARYADWNEQDRYLEVARLLRRIKDEHKKQRKHELTTQLRDAEAAADDQRARELMQQIVTLNKEINA